MVSVPDLRSKGCWLESYQRPGPGQLPRCVLGQGSLLQMPRHKITYLCCCAVKRQIKPNQINYNVYKHSSFKINRDENMIINLIPLFMLYPETGCRKDSQQILLVTYETFAITMYLKKFLFFVYISRTACNFRTDIFPATSLF